MQVFVLSGILSGYSGRADQGKSMQEPQGCHRPLTAFVDHLTSCTNFIPIHSEYHWLPGQNGWLNCTAVGGGECGDGDTRKWLPGSRLFSPGKMWLPLPWANALVGHLDPQWFFAGVAGKGNRSVQYSIALSCPPASPGKSHQKQTWNTSFKSMLILLSSLTP